MPHYIRAYVPGGTYFFTVNLLERKRHLLVEHIEALRNAFRIVKQQRSFRIDAIVILPDHLHCIWTMPPDDCDFSTRWRLIKSAFSGTIEQGERLSRRRQVKSERGIWQRRFLRHAQDRFGNTPSAIKTILTAISITSITTPSNMAGLKRFRSGRIRVFIVLCAWGFIPKTGLLH